MYETLTRIRDLMKEAGMKDVEMESYLGVPHGTFSNWKRGKSRTYYENIDRIADRLGVSIDYLVRGLEVDSDALSSREVKLVAGFRKLSEEAKDVIEKNVRLLACS